MIHVTREQYLLLVVVDVWLVVAVVLPARATHTRPPAAGLPRLPRLHHVSVTWLSAACQLILL